MSVSNVLNCRSPVSFTIGAFTYSNIAAFGWRQEAIEGGDVVTPRTVAGSHVPVGYTHHPKCLILTISIDSDGVIQNLNTAGLWNLNGENGAPSALSFVDKHADGRTRTVSFVAANSRVQNVELKYNQPDKPLTEVKIITYGTITYSNWS
ncbi:MAG: hypothetical protein FWG55_05840 [Candidatus Bathyarchaeota archaeon]|nr:hypothetical protein [Candidatus Termiticorpusculum sp.]